MDGVTPIKCFDSDTMLSRCAAPEQRVNGAQETTWVSSLAGPQVAHKQTRSLTERAN